MNAAAGLSRFRVLAVCLLLTVAGCAAPPPPETAAPKPQAAGTPEVIPEATSPVASAPAQPEARAPAPPPLPPVNTDPRQFVGLTAGELVGRLGVPSFRRIDQPAMVWQYRGGSCIVDVFLFRERGDDRVYEVLVRRPRGVQQIRDDNCLAGLIRSRSLAAAS